MRKRFSLGAICSADGTSDVYYASRRAHINHLSGIHQSFVSSDLAKSFMGISSGAAGPTIHGIYHEVKLFGVWQPLPQGSNLQKYIDGNFQLR